METYLKVKTRYYKYKMIIKIIDQGYVGFYHWIIYMISNLRYLPDNIIPEYIYVPYLDDDSNKYQVESLKMIYPEVKLINAKYEKEPNKIDWIAPMCPEPAWRGAPVNEDIYKYLRNKYYNHIEVENSTEKYKYVYISRKYNTQSLGHPNISARHILNENEMMEELKKYGFVEITLEGKSMADQIAIFKNANILISPHGAALANCCFASLNTHIIEVAPKECEWQHFSHICNSLNVPYTRFTDIITVSHEFNGNIDVSKLLNVVINIINENDIK